MPAVCPSWGKTIAPGWELEVGAVGALSSQIYLPGLELPQGVPHTISLEEAGYNDPEFMETPSMEGMRIFCTPPPPA